MLITRPLRSKLLCKITKRVDKKVEEQILSFLRLFPRLQYLAPAVKDGLLFRRNFGKENNDGNSSGYVQDSTSNSTACDDEQVHIVLLTSLLQGCL